MVICFVTYCIYNLTIILVSLELCICTTIICDCGAYVTLVKWVELYCSSSCPLFPPSPSASSPRITVVPENATAPLNSNASFYCETVGAEILWRIRGTQLSKTANPDDVQDFRDVGIVAEFGENSSTLYIVASDTNNVTDIRCIGFITVLNLMSSPTVFLTVYGEYRPVS